MKVLYFIGSYGPEAMGSASHEQTILALRDRGHHVDVLTQINRPDVGRYTRVEYEGVPVYRVNLSPKSVGGRERSEPREPPLQSPKSGSGDSNVWTLGFGLTRRTAARLFQYEYLPVLV